MNTILLSKGNNNILLAILLSLLGFSSQAQDYLEPHFYPFIDYNKSEIKYGSPEALDHFFSTLDTLVHEQSGKVNIVHIGDSHLQADFFSHQVRKSLQKDILFNSGGRGFIFPYSTAKTNNPGNYISKHKGKWTGCRNSVNKHSCEWGVSGISSTTRDSTAHVIIGLNQAEDTISPTYLANRFKVFYPTEDSTQYGVYIQLNDSLIAPKDSGIGYVQFDLDTLLATVDFRIKKIDSLENNFIWQGLTAENSAPGIVYSTMGVNGAKIKSYLRCNKFSQHLSALDPDLVIVSLGTNDAYDYSINLTEFKGYIRQITKNIRESSPNTSILFTAPGDGLRKRWQTNYNNKKVALAYEEMSRELGFATWNFFEVMGGINSIKKWQAYGLAKRDFLHLTVKGYVLQGSMLYDALLLQDYFGKNQHFMSW